MYIFLHTTLSIFDWALNYGKYGTQQLQARDRSHWPFIHLKHKKKKMENEGVSGRLEKYTI
jgi:hypothetical protein